MTFPEMEPMDRRISLGNVLTIAALVLSLGGGYAAFASRMAVIETKLEAIATSVATQKVMEREIYELRTRIHTLEREIARETNGVRP